VKRLFVFLALLAGSVSANAMLVRGPEIVSVTINGTNSDTIYLHLDGLESDLAVSTDAGRTFSFTPKVFTPGNLTTNLHFPPRHYAFVEQCILLRSDDNGMTWTNTTARRFLREQTDRIIKRERAAFDEQTRDRLPERTPWWHGVFGTFGIAYCIFIVAGLHKSKGWLQLISILCRGIIVLGLVWMLLQITHWYFLDLARNQWPGRFWNTSMEFYPSLKTGIVMNIAAKPWPLLGYLLAWGLLLPGTTPALLSIVGPQLASRKRFCLALSVAVGTHFLLFHLLLLFWGHFNG
jgi:hypothetical protein